jgi:hypothetical protein
VKTADVNQLLIDWTGTAAPPGAVGKEESGSEIQPLVLRLKWDFRTSFPEPTEEAIDAGILQPEDATDEGIRSIHEEHARELLVVLNDLSAVMDARRMGVDPATGRTPRTDAGRKRLAVHFAKEPGQLQHRKEILLGSYADAFGYEAAAEFEKAVDAWHAGIEVVGEKSPQPVCAAIPAPVTTETRTHPKRGSPHVLPCPKPLPAAVKTGQFGYEENGQPVRPGTAETRAIIRNHADKLIDLLDELRTAPQAAKDSLRNRFAAGVAAFAEDFGNESALRLETYVEREASAPPGCRSQ